MHNIIFLLSVANIHPLASYLFLIIPTIMDMIIVLFLSMHRQTLNAMSGMPNYIQLIFPVPVRNIDMN
jgi:hypothetical protein